MFVASFAVFCLFSAQVVVPYPGVWGHAHALFEQAGKVLGVGDAHPRGHLRDAGVGVGVLKQPAGLLDTQAGEVFVGRTSHGTLELGIR